MWLVPQGYSLLGVWRHIVWEVCTIILEETTLNLEGRKDFFFFLPEDAHSRFLQNVGTYRPNLTVSYPRRVVLIHTTVKTSNHKKCVCVLSDNRDHFWQPWLPVINIWLRENADVIVMGLCWSTHTRNRTLVWNYCFTLLYPQNRLFWSDVSQMLSSQGVDLPYILKSNPHPFYSFRGLKNQMRIRFTVVSWFLEKW